MTYDKKSFLAGIAVGRQLKGWNLYPQEASMVGWTANPGWVWRQPGLIGHINPGTVTTLQDLNLGSGLACAKPEGNLIKYTATGSNPNVFRISKNDFPRGARVMFDLTVISASSYIIVGGSGDYPVIGTGVFVVSGNTSVRAETLGRGTATFTSWGGSSEGYIQAGGSWGSTGSVYCNGVYVNDLSWVPGGDNLYKKKAGPAIVCIARYINADGIQITTPVLISDRQTAVEWSFFQDGITQESYTTQQEYHGNLYYMGTAGDLLTGSASSSTGAQILDLTAGSRITTSTELFLAVASASGLSTL